MSIEASTLSIVVKSDGIAANTEALNKLAAAGDRAEKSTAKLAKANKASEASAKQSEKVWYELLHKSAQFYEKQYNMQQQHNNRLYSALQAEANKLNKAHDRIIAQDAANSARRRKQEQDQLQQLDVLRRNAAAKEYARAQQEANRLNAMMDRARKQQEAAAKASAERQRVLNSTYSTSSLSQQISTLQRAQAYGASGGNVTSRFGSAAAGAVSSGELQRLQAQYRQLGNEARRANTSMADTHAAVRGLSGSLGALWLTYGNILPLVAGAAVGAAIKGVISVGSDVEHTLEKIRVLGQATTGEIDQMRATILQMGQGVQGPRDVAEAFSVLTLAGLKASDALKAVGATLNLAIAGDVSIEKASSTLVQISTSLGYTANDFGHLADVVAKTAAVSMSSVDSISGAFLSAAAVGEVYGATLKDIGTGLAAVANLGIQGTAAGTTLKNFYADLAKGSERSTASLKAMGLTLLDLKDEDGAFISMLDLVTKLDKGFDKLTKQARVEAMDRLFGERGIKTGAALLKMVNQVSTEVDHLTGKTYDNKLAEVFGEIEKAAAFSTTAAIAMAQTTQNQLKSVGNTLQTSFGEAFTAVAPQIGEIARKLKAAFASPEFINGIKFITTGIANLTLFVVEHAKQIGVMIAAYAGWKIGVFAAGIVTMAKGFDVAKIAARGFTAALGPLGLAIAALGVAWELYANQKNKAITDNDANANSLDEYAKGIEEAAQNEAKALKMRMAGMSEQEVARKEQLEKDRTASAKLIQQSADGVNAMKATMDQQWAALSDNQKKRAKLFLEGKVTSTDRMGTDDFVKQYAAYNSALEKHNRTVAKVKQDENALFRDRQKNAEMSDKAAKELWGSKGFGTGELGNPKEEKAAEKMVKFAANEALEMNKAVGQYEAKNAALRESIRLGQIIQADSKQAIVLENLKAGKYGSKSADNPVYQHQRALAAQEDAAKAENSRLKKHEEFANKLAETEAAQIAFNKAAADGSNTHIGALRKEAEGLIQILSLNKDEAEVLRKRADAMDSFRKQQEALVKLESATANSRERAEAALEEAQAMQQYGEVTKLTAMQVAELLIQKRKLTEAGADATVAALREAAATEQLNVAYRNLTKMALDANQELEDAQAESMLIFTDSEAEKIRIATETKNKLAAIALEQARQAFDAKAGAGKGTFEDFEAMAAAYNKYNQTIETNEKASIVQTNNLRLRDWKKTVDDIEQIGREGFFSLSQKGVSIWSSMTKTFKSMFKTTVMEYIYKEFAKPLVLKVVASLAGLVGADGLAQAANTMGGGGTSASSVINNVYSAITGGFDKVASGIANTYDSVTGMFGPGTIGSTGPSATGSMVGSIGASVGGFMAGNALNGAISGKYETGSGFMKAQTVATAVASYINPALGAVVGAVSGLINRAFGRGPKEIQNEGIRGTISTDGTTGESYSNWKREGGWFRSDKTGTDVSAMTHDLVNTFTSGLNTLKASSNDFAKNLGVSSDALTGYSKTFDITITKDTAANQEAITKFFTEMGDDMANKLIPNIMEFAKQGETASVVLQRLSDTFSVTKNLADALGKSVEQVFGADGLGSAAARTKLVDLSGGLDALAQKTSAYVAAIYSDSQKLAPVQKALTEAMSSLGLASVTTKDQFKSVVDGLNLTSEADIKLFNSLMELAPAFAQITDAAKTAADEMAKANSDLMENSLGALSRAIDREKENIDKKYEAAIDHVRKAADAAEESAQKQLEAAEKQRDAISSVLENLKGAMQSTQVESAALTKARRTEAQSYLAVSAIQVKSGGDITKLGGLNDALEAIAKPSEDLFGSFEEYARDQAFAAHNIAALQGSAQSQLDYAELTISKLDATIDTIQKNADVQIATLEKNRDAENEALDNILNKAQEQLDALNGINTSVQGVIEAMNNFNAGMATVRASEIAQKTGNNGLAVESLYKDLLGRGADSGGLGYWTSKANGGTSISNIADAIKGSKEYQSKSIEDLYKNILGRSSDAGGKAYWMDRLNQGSTLYDIEQAIRNSLENNTNKGIPSFDIGTNFVERDMFAKVHKGERIMPAADNSKLERALNSQGSSEETASLKAEIAQLKEVIMSGDVANVQATKELVRLLKKFDQEGMPEVRDVTA